MPLDKIKHPSKFPAAFHDIFLRGEGEFLIQTGERQADAYREARRFRTFLKSLKNYPLHPTAQVAKLWHARTVVKEDPVVNAWDFYIILEDRAGMLEAAERVLENFWK